MDPADIAARLQETFADGIVEVLVDAPDPMCVVQPSVIADVARFLRDDPELQFTSLMCLSGVDYGDQLGVVYNIHSIPLRHRFCLKVLVPRDDPDAAHVPTVSQVWRTADWHEREAYDMVGVVFDDHPDLRRILLPDDWVGHPLRKDYAFPREWHGIPV
ncbi:MAG: NADH-quinone oxidoreductase subunit C [Candidatus Eiseniibacteriota bacterium]|jgi:NADH-quinone oxidoreductase subunit C